jgi:AraC-like DNA-binding protein
MPNLPRRLYLPKPDRAYWRAPRGSNHGLEYLAWGERRFGDAPMPCSRHDGWVFTVMEAGAPLVVTEGGTSRFEAGTALIMGPDFAYGWSDARRRSCRLLQWMFRRPLTQLFLRQRPAYYAKIRLTPAVLKRLRLIHAMCREEIRTGGPAMDMALDALQRLLEATLNGCRLTTSTEAKPASLLQPGLAWIDSHLEAEQPVARLADFLGISVSTLFRRFKSELGESPHTYFRRQRMELARRKIAAGRPVKEVAFVLGYRHAEDLSRAYRRHFGFSPKKLPEANNLQR